jgi:hypothetical protein
MSPPKSKKAASRKAAKKAGKAAKSSKAPRKAAKSSRKGTKAKPSGRASKSAGSAKPTAAATGHAHCAATDPFGGTCQNLPRRPSKYCVIHSYLER